MKNLLKLHEAIAVVLLGIPNRTATFKEIETEIAKRELYRRLYDGELPPADQIKLRTTMSQGQYFHLFEKVGDDGVRLRNCN